VALASGAIFLGGMARIVGRLVLANEDSLPQIPSRIPPTGGLDRNCKNIGDSILHSAAL
jgi:hypothetical protein